MRKARRRIDRQQVDNVVKRVPSAGVAFLHLNSNANPSRAGCALALCLA